MSEVEPVMYHGVRSHTPDTRSGSGLMSNSAAGPPSGGPAAGERTASATTPLLDATGLNKRYGGVLALRDASFRINGTGVIHALMGENGSGKSTLLGILSGQVRPDSGALMLGNQPLSFGSAPEAVRAGIAMVSQETAIAPDLTVAENILLGTRLIRARGRIDWKATYSRAQTVLERLKLDYDPRWRVERLRPDQQQMIEIARALSIDARVLILDEPTSFLVEREVEALFRAVREVASHGVSTIFVSHRLAEVFEISDAVTVLRDGRTVSTGPITDYDPERLVEHMVGQAAETERSMETERYQPPQTAAADKDEADGNARLRVRRLSHAGAFSSVDLDVDGGEIVGLAGLAGSGRTALLESVFGGRRASSGTIHVDDQLLSRHGPTDAIAAGIGFVPAERKIDGLVLTMSVADNLGMASTSDAPWWRRPRHVRSEEVTRLVADLRIKANSPEADVATLSGGNQQKVALGKWLLNRPSLLLLEEPTRGVDVRAKREIHEILRGLAGSGVGVLVSSSENDELLALCDRVLVMFQGEIVADVVATDVSESKLARLAGGMRE
jgi:ABC-type sugar transport system ATPase subunit